MRLVTIDSRETGGRPGVVIAGTEVADGEILDIVASPGSLGDTQWLPQSVVSVLAAGADGLAQTARMVAGVQEATPGERAALRQAGRLLPYAGTALLAPIRRPGLMLMLESMEQPVADAWIKSPNAAAAPAGRVALPSPRLERLGVRPRVALVLGRPLFAAGRDQAARAIAGFTLVADLGPAPVAGATPEPETRPGRQFAGACPLGPAIYTPDELPARPPVHLECRVNGHVVADSVTDLGTDALARMLAAVSTSYALRPGDIIALPAAGGSVTLGAGDRCSLALGGLPGLTFSVG
jgi:acylpyruvate hydrolase